MKLYTASGMDVLSVPWFLNAQQNALRKSDREKLISLKLIMEGFSKLSFPKMTECLKEYYRLIGEYGDNDEKAIHKFRLFYAVYLLALGVVDKAGVLFFHAVCSDDVIDELLSPSDLVLYALLTNILTQDGNTFVSKLLIAPLVNQNLDTIPYLKDFMKLIHLNSYGSDEFMPVLDALLCHMRIDRYMAAHTVNYLELIRGLVVKNEASWVSVNHIGGLIQETRDSTLISDEVSRYYLSYMNSGDHMYEQLVRFSKGEACSFGSDSICSESEDSVSISSKLFEASGETSVPDRGIHINQALHSNIFIAQGCSSVNFSVSPDSSHDSNAREEPLDYAESYASEEFEPVLDMTSEVAPDCLSSSKAPKSDSCVVEVECQVEGSIQMKPAPESEDPVKTQTQPIIQVAPDCLSSSKAPKSDCCVVEVECQVEGSIQMKPAPESEDPKTQTQPIIQVPIPDAIDSQSYSIPKSDNYNVDIRTAVKSSIQVCQDVVGSIQMKTFMPAPGSVTKREKLATFLDIPTAQTSGPLSSTQGPLSSTHGPLSSTHGDIETDHCTVNINEVHDSSVQVVKGVKGNVLMTANEPNLSRATVPIPVKSISPATTVVSPTRTMRTERVGNDLATVAVYLAIVTGVYAYVANQAKEIKSDFYKQTLVDLLYQLSLNQSLLYY